MNFNKSYIEEFSNLTKDEFYELCKGDSDLTKEELENSLNQLFNTNQSLEALSSVNLDSISGGKGFGKKSVATALAMLSLGGAMPSTLNTLDASPKASALFSSFKIQISDPTEMNEIIEHIRTDNFYKKQLAAYMGTDSNILNDENAFKNWWKNNDNGKKWWTTSMEKKGGNISCAHAKTLEQAKNSGSTHIIDPWSSKEEIDFAKNINDSLPEVHSAINLLNAYIKTTAEKNKLSKVDINNKTNSLFKSKQLRETVNKYFGVFTVTQRPGMLKALQGEESSYKEYRAFDYLLYSLSKGDSPEQKWNNKMFIHNVKKAAPWAGAACMGLILLLSASQVRDLLSSAGSAVQRVAIKAYNRFIYNRMKMEQDPVKLKELMSQYLKTSVFRQDEAMDKITEIMGGMADLWANSDKTGEPCTSACTMTFMGDSGIGKTYAARMLSKALFHKDMQPWQFITSTSVTGASVSTSNKSKKGAPTEEKLSPADQLFNENSELIRQLKLNNRVIIVLDEVDKMHRTDPDDTILERLRDARDTGKLLVRKGVNYEYVDVSRTVFICITNELRECWGLPPEQLTPAQSAARTNIQRDKSLVNRFDVVEFKYFKSEDYEFILRPELDKLKEEYSKTHNIDIEFTDEFIKSVSDAAEIKNKGVRGVNDYMVLLRGKLVDFRSKNVSNNQKKVVSAKFNSELETFEIN